MDELLDEVQQFLNQENETLGFEMHYELECQICAEDGFSECQGHLYSDEAGYI
jgi:hypothetical protein